MYGFKYCLGVTEPPISCDDDVTEFLIPADMNAGSAFSELVTGTYGFYGPWGWAPLADCVDDEPVAKKKQAKPVAFRRPKPVVEEPKPVQVEEVALQSVSAAVKAARDEAGISTDMVALVSGMSRARLLAIEADEKIARSMSWTEIAGLSIALGVEPSAFLPMVKVSEPKGAA